MAESTFESEKLPKLLENMRINEESEEAASSSTSSANVRNRRRDHRTEHADYNGRLVLGPRFRRPRPWNKQQQPAPTSASDHDSIHIYHLRNAMFYVIKCSNEDDIYRSIKHEVWSTTPYALKKLNAAYHQATHPNEDCPVYLFFSVNGSGHFYGVAKMTGEVDFEKCTDWWLHGKQSGCFPVEWIIIKDVPNTKLRHITLKFYNDEIKPVTHRKNAQKLHVRGREMLNLFNNFSSETCILDDSAYYELREQRRKLRDKEQPTSNDNTEEKK